MGKRDRRNTRKGGGRRTSAYDFVRDDAREDGRSVGDAAKNFVAGALTAGALALGAQQAVVNPLDPGTGTDQIGHYTSAQQEQNAGQSVQEGTNDTGNRGTWTSQER